MSVAVQPGQTAFTRIAGSSAARILVSAFNAAFEMLYAGVPPPIEASEPRSLETLNDPRIVASPQERQQGLHDSPRAEQIRLECLVNDRQVRVTGVRPRVVEHRGVVDEGVESRVRLDEFGREATDAVVAPDVELAHVHVREPERLRGCVSSGELA